MGFSIATSKNNRKKNNSTEKKVMKLHKNIILKELKISTVLINKKNNLLAESEIFDYYIIITVVKRGEACLFLDE